MAEANEAVENKVDNTTDQQAATDETKNAVDKNKVDDTTTDQAADQKQNESDIDFAEELEKAKAETANWKQAALDAKDKLKKQKKNTDGGAEDDADDLSQDDDSEKAAAIIRQAVREEVAPLASELLGNNISDILSSLSANPKEQELIKFHYENSIVKSGMSKEAIMRDLRNAQAIANQKRLQKERDEALNTAKNKQAINNSSMGHNEKTNVDVSNLKFTTMEMDVIRRSAARAGVSPEDYIKKHYASS